MFQLTFSHAANLLQKLGVGVAFGLFAMIPLVIFAHLATGF